LRFGELLSFLTNGFLHDTHFLLDSVRKSIVIIDHCFHSIYLSSSDLLGRFCIALTPYNLFGLATLALLTKTYSILWPFWLHGWLFAWGGSKWEWSGVLLTTWTNSSNEWTQVEVGVNSALQASTLAFVTT
jgi:hypothetical protein